MVGDNTSSTELEDFESVRPTTSVGVDASVGAMDDFRDGMYSLGEYVLVVSGESVEVWVLGLLWPCRALVEYTSVGMSKSVGVHAAL